MPKIKQDRPYNPRSMNCERIPFGCLLWIFIILGGIVYLFYYLTGGI